MIQTITVTDAVRIIDATAISLDYTVVTVNIRDFEKIPGVKMEKLQ